MSEPSESLPASPACLKGTSDTVEPQGEVGAPIDTSLEVGPWINYAY